MKKKSPVPVPVPAQEELAVSPPVEPTPTYQCRTASGDYELLKLEDHGDKGFILVLQHAHTAVRSPLPRPLVKALRDWLDQRLS